METGKGVKRTRFGGVLEFRIVQFAHATFSGQLDGMGWDGLVVYPLRAWRDGSFWYMVPVQIAVALPKEMMLPSKHDLICGRNSGVCSLPSLVLARVECTIACCATMCTTALPPCRWKYRHRACTLGAFSSCDSCSTGARQHGPSGGTREFSGRRILTLIYC